MQHTSDASSVTTVGPTSAGRSVLGAVAAGAACLAALVAGFLPALQTSVVLGGTSDSVASYAYVTGQQAVDSESPTATSGLLVLFLTAVAVLVVVGTGATSVALWRGGRATRMHALACAAAVAWASDWTWFAICRPVASASISRTLGAGGFALLVVLAGALVALVTCVPRLSQHEPSPAAPLGRWLAPAGIGLGSLLLLPAYETSSAGMYVDGRVVQLTAPHALVVDRGLVPTAALVVTCLALVVLGCWGQFAPASFARTSATPAGAAVVALTCACGLLLAYEAVPGAALSALSGGSDTTVTAGLVLGTLARACVARGAYRWVRRTPTPAPRP